MEYEGRPRLTPAIADVRRAVRDLLDGPLIEPVKIRSPGCDERDHRGLVLVGLSGGADSLALAAATAFEAPRTGFRAGAVIVDHGLQEGSADVAATAAEQAGDLGLAPVLVLQVTVGPGSSGTAGRAASGGPEADARVARYAAFERALAKTGAERLLLGHTLDDQAETVLLGLARGSGPTSLQGMAPGSGPYLRPLLGIRRAQTSQFCVDSGLAPWNDPHNLDPRYTRVRVRENVLPTLERELGPGVALALARTAEQLREDAAALDELVLEFIEEICEPAEAGIAVSVGALTSNPPALRQRIIRFVAESEFGVSLERVHTLAVSQLVTDWHGQKALDLPGVRVERQGGLLIFAAPGHAPSKGLSRFHGTS